VWTDPVKNPSYDCCISKPTTAMRTWMVTPSAVRVRVWVLPACAGKGFASNPPLMAVANEVSPPRATVETAMTPGNWYTAPATSSRSKPAVRLPVKPGMLGSTALTCTVTLA
jgi:hypothetical protein